MPRRRQLFNPVHIIRWEAFLKYININPMTLVGEVRLLIDQANGPGQLPDNPIPQDIFFIAQQIYDATNEVIDDFWPSLARQATPVQLTSSTITFTAVATAGTAGNDIFTFDNTTIMVPSYLVLNSSTGTGAGQVVTDQKYWITDRSKLEQYNNNWKQFTPALPRWFVLWDAFHIRCFPSPDQNYAFTLYGVPWGTEVGTSTEDITADPILKLAIAYKAAANILETTRPDTADAYMRESAELLNRYRIRLRNANTNNMRRMKPGVGASTSDITIAANKGVIKIGRRLS